MGNLSGVVGQLQKELSRTQQKVQRFTAVLADLGNPGSNGQHTLFADAHKRICIAQKIAMGKDSKGIAACSNGENNRLRFSEAHHVGISPSEDRRRSTGTLGEGEGEAEASGTDLSVHTRLCVHTA
jgi:hypothetical protein